MTLSPGSRLGPYEILSALGAGGMGEVYRARDTRLDRIVAIKILPAHLSDKPAARERFEREAKSISGLNHPNICHLYDVGAQDNVRYLVMEYLEGETLADRLAKGSLPLDQLLRYGLDICEGLETAHRSGVVHRDLKPGNIILTKSGAKLLDFGLAKPTLADASTGSSSALMTMTRPLTAEGSWVGTFQYMSPEQVEGRDVDGRSDIFSLGAVLYEMATGQLAFEGKSQISVASAILEKEPASVSAARPTLPQALDHAIRRCLAKDPDQRWQTVRDLAHTLKWIAESGPQIGASGVGRKSPREAWLLAALAVATAAAVVLGLQYANRAPAETRVTRSYIRPMNESRLLNSDASGFALSPDGRTLAFVASTSDSKSVLWIRPIASLRAEPLAGTSGARYPFWSADGRYLGFFAGGKLKTVEATGGPALTVCDAADGRGGTWNRDGVILFTPGVNSPICRVPASGGTPVAVTMMDATKTEISHRWPWFLPDGRHFLFLAGSVFTSTDNPTNVIELASLDSGETKTLVRTHAGAIFASGRLLFLRQSTLMAQPLDLTRLELTGSPVPVADHVQEAEIYSRGLYSASENGLLAYIEGTGSANRQLIWFDRKGTRIAEVPGNGAYASPHISPDGNRLLYYLDSGGFDVWTYDLARGVKAPQTFGSASSQGNLFPVWSPDGRRFAFTTYREGKYFLSAKASDGSSGAETLLQGVNRYRFPSDWSPDGKFLAYHEGSQGGWSIWMLPLTGERKPYLFLQTEFSARDAAFSPDGRWIAYCSNESGEYKVYIAPFPGPGGKWLVSTGGGYSPRWRHDGKEIFYFSSDDQLMAVDVKQGQNLVEVGTPRALFATFSYGVFGRFDVTRDGQRFIVPYEAGDPTTAITLVFNWPADLKQ